VEVVQPRTAFFAQGRAAKLEAASVTYQNFKQDFDFRGGRTRIIEPVTGRIRYCVSKSMLIDDRMEKERRFPQGQFGDKVGGACLGG
jgi:hypothetical protein